ncbi:hypothetical protein [Algibacter mikhailovii]|uniref:hypothetical protein n=1 Tax=Algibacter mikhailovii TaxID=425498 RepID=UPI0024947A6E|nr:hypothetical protein [Algibacter mikhailovii]
MYSENDKKGYPGFQMLEIKDTIAEFYTDFSLENQAIGLKVLEDKILTSKNVKFANYKVVSENHLKLFVDGKANGKDAVFECDFYRLKPTITTLKKENIEKMIFIRTENGQESEFEFNKEIWDKETLELFKKKEGEKK